MLRNDELSLANINNMKAIRQRVNSYIFIVLHNIQLTRKSNKGRIIATNSGFFQDQSNSLYLYDKCYTNSL